MQSAKDLMMEITEIVCASITHLGDEEYAREADIKIEFLIRARDREIVEACKKVVHGEDWRGVHGRGPAIDDALDKVLRDLG